MVETLILGAFDVAMCAGLLWLAWRLLSVDDLFTAIVLFICYGLFMALTWVRLKAPDIAMAEAAIGAGVTGVLLLAALGRIAPVSLDRMNASSKKNIVVATMATIVTACLTFMILDGPSAADIVKLQVSNAMVDSGVTNPVTAVLLNFRSYDTLLEVVVLLAAVIGVWSLGPSFPPSYGATDSMLSTVVRLLIPLMIVVAVYILWVGAYAPGGAFQAGAVLAAAGLLWLLIGQGNSVFTERKVMRFILVLGPLVFALSALLLLLVEGGLLKYPIATAGNWIFVIETAALISIAATLIVLFLGGRPSSNQDEERGA